MFFGGGTDAPFGADFLAPSETATQEEFSPYLILPGSAACRGRIRSKSANAGNLVSEGILHCHSGCNRIAGGGSSWMKASLMPMPLTIPSSLQGEQGEGRGYQKKEIKKWQNSVGDVIRLNIRKKKVEVKIKARYNRIVRKVPLNLNQSVNQSISLKIWPLWSPSVPIA